MSSWSVSRAFRRLRPKRATGLLGLEPLTQNWACSTGRACPPFEKELESVNLSTEEDSCATPTDPRGKRHSDNQCGRGDQKTKPPRQIGTEHPCETSYTKGAIDHQDQQS